MQVNRMFEIIYILMDKKVVTAKELAQRFDVSTRTIYRDIELLSSAKIPVYMKKGKGGGISILDDFILNKTVLTDEEKADILSSLKAMDIIQFHETNSIANKIGALFGERNSNWIEVDFSSWNKVNNEAEIFNQIKKAILSKKIISFTYASGKGEKTSRIVEPLKLCFKGISRYLYAYCTLRQDFRFFKLKRITNLVVKDEHYQREIPKQIFNSDIIKHQKQITIKLKFSAQMEYRVYDEFNDYIQQPDGSFLVEFNCLDNENFFSYIMSFGSCCEVLEPRSLREQIKKELLKTVNYYL